MTTPASPRPQAPPDAVLETLLAQGRDLQAATDAQGRIVWTNTRFRERTGWIECLGAALPPRLCADDGMPDPDLQRRIAAALAGVGPLTDTVVQLDPPLPGASPLWLRLAIGGAGAMRVWTMTDVGAERAERLRANLLQARLTACDDQSAPEASAQLELAIDLARVTIWRHDLLSDRIHHNPRGFEVLGLPYRSDGMPIDEVRRLIHPDDVAAVVEAAQRTLTSDGPVDVHARYRRSDGAWRHALTRRVVQRDAEGRPCAFLGVALDLTDQVEEQRHAAETAHRLDIAASAAGIGVWSRDTTTEEAHWNSQMFRLCGRDPALGPPTREDWVDTLMHPDDRARMRHAREDMFDAGDRLVEHEYRIIRPDGEVRWLVNLARLETWNGRTMIFGATLDITERRQAEATQREALAAQRLNEARSHLLARVSHELRTPLNAILGFTQLLELDALRPPSGAAPGAHQPDDQRLVKLSQIRHASEHLLTLVNEVLDLSSIEAGQLHLHPRPVGLDEVLGEALGGAAAAARARAVSLDGHAQGQVVMADRARLLQVLVKLIDHRLPHVPAGGLLQLQAEADGDEVRIAVIDDGDALTPAQQLQLFEPFGRLAAPGSPDLDTGVNLALVKALMACMGGRIALGDAGPAGARIVLTLPRAGTAAADTALAAVPAQEASAPAAGKVLYIEDNPINVILVEELIAQRGGLELACESTGEEGVARAREMRPDLVLIDMQLPDFDGFEVLRRLRADPLTASTNCIALSANAMPDDVARALAAGFDDYWTKPIRFGRFLAGLDGLFPRSLAV